MGESLAAWSGVLLVEGEIPWKQYLPVLLLGFTLLFLFRMSQRRRNAARRQAAAPPASEGEARAAPIGTTARQDPEVAKLYIELSEFAREMEGRMDTKIAYLRKLLDEAERVLGELNSAIDQGAIVRGAVERGATIVAKPVVEPTPATGPTAAATAAASPAGELAGAPEPALVDVLVGGPPDRGVAPGSSPTAGDAALAGGGVGAGGGGDLRGRILALAEEGQPPEAIAEALEVPKGEVELVLSLERAASRKSSGRRR